MESRKEEMSRIIKVLLKDMTPEQIASKLDTSVSSIERYRRMKIDAPQRRLIKILRRMVK